MDGKNLSRIFVFDLQRFESKIWTLAKTNTGLTLTSGSDTITLTADSNNLCTLASTETAFTTGDTIQVTSNLDLGNYTLVIGSGVTATLDLQSSELKGASNAVIVDGGTLNIKGNGWVDDTGWPKITANTSFLIRNNGTCTMTGVHLNGTNYCAYERRYYGYWRWRLQYRHVHDDRR